MARDKECLHELLEAAGIPFISRGKGSHLLIGKYLYAFYIIVLSLTQLIRFRPGLTLSLSSPYLITASRFLHIPTLTYDDTDFNPRLHPAIKRANYIFSPSNYPHTFHKYHFLIQTYKELAYLEPPQPGKEKLRDSVFFRITRTDSIHHSTQTRISIPGIINEINRVSELHSTFLSSETAFTGGLSENVRFPDKVNIHQDMKRSMVFWGNSATMAAEAVIMGIPSIFVGSEKFAYLQEMEEHGLLYCFPPDQIELSFKKLDDLLAKPVMEVLSGKPVHQLLRRKINITGLLIWFIENLPHSADELRADEDIQLRFKTI